MTQPLNQERARRCGRARLRSRAARNRRSLQGELLDLVERAADEVPTIAARDVFDRIRKLNLPAGESSTDIIRELRDGR